MLKLCIDSMIWIYYFDPNAIENENVVSWFDNEEQGMKKYEKIVLTPIIPLEVMHNLGNDPRTDFNLVYNASMSILALNKTKVIDLTAEFFESTLDTYGRFRDLGIGGRDATIVTLYENNHVDMIATHDKNILRISGINRIDPVFDPPLILKQGTEINESDFER